MVGKDDFREKYAWKPWRANSRFLYEKEEYLLNRVLEGTNHKIYFFGSSSIEDVGGKGFIDIYISTDNAEVVNEELIAVGYEFKINAGDDERLFFQKYFTDGSNTLAYHVHVTKFNNRGLVESLAFRDFLNINNKYADEYSEIKKTAGEKASQQLDRSSAKKVYMEIKSPVIDKIMQMVRSYILENPEKYKNL